VRGEEDWDEAGRDVSAVIWIREGAEVVLALDVVDGESVGDVVESEVAVVESEAIIAGSKDMEESDDVMLSTGSDVGMGMTVDVMTPPGGYGHQSKLDVESCGIAGGVATWGGTSVTGDASWRGRTCAWAIMREAIKRTKRTKSKRSRGIALSKYAPPNRHSGASADSLDFADGDSTLYGERREVADRPVESEPSSQKGGAADKVERRCVQCWTPCVAPERGRSDW
jgi:hypothetical protein